ncbi:MAG: pyridoxine 5'-phosphate synthase, partial [Phycisphaerae bacterium]
MVRLGVNIDHVATVRQARRTDQPDPLWAAGEAELGGADGITFHLREDRRHINDRDARLLKETVRVKLNMEMSVAEEIVNIAADLRPDQCCLVPERREVLTTVGGLDVVRHRAR